MAESKKITITPDDVDSIIKEYREQRAAASQITVEFSGVNNLDTLLLLRIMNLRHRLRSEKSFLSRRQS